MAVKMGARNRPMLPSAEASDGAVHIELATWRDLSGIRQVERVCFEEDTWPLLDLIAALTFPDVVHLKAVVNGEIIGFAGGDVRRTEHMGWITTLGVIPEFRRRGIAAELLAEAEKAIGQPRIRLCVRRSNTGAIQLYDRFDYHQVGVWPAYYQDGEDALVMEKSFEPEKGKNR